MQNVDIFVHMAEIAGVFVGFGALIALRTGSSLGAGDIAEIRWVMSSGIWVVMSALVPILLAGYGISGHDLWLTSSLIAICLMVATLTVNGISAENRADVVATFGRDRVFVMKAMAAMAVTFWLPTLALFAALVLVVLGPFPVREEALYLSAIGLGLFTSALNLLGQVFEPTTTAPRTGE